MFFEKYTVRLFSLNRGNRWTVVGYNQWFKQRTSSTLHARNYYNAINVPVRYDTVFVRSWVDEMASLN